MTPGFYVMRRTPSGKSLILESTCFRPMPEKGVPLDWTRRQADEWAGYVQEEYPSHDVFVMEVHPRPERTPEAETRKSSTIRS